MRRKDERRRLGIRQNDRAAHTAHALLDFGAGASMPPRWPLHAGHARLPYRNDLWIYAS
ncbi:hypothetical protein BRI6_0373 [plant metagenome]|uniref:Uncharacterized protein n=1 Tax=plant metagenome TaxID=1297885 RepID=A0A484XMF6_9ZZZZ